MAEDNFVAMGQAVCPACGTVFENGTILFDKRLQSIPDNKRVTGWEMCKDCQALKDQGYVAFVEVDESRSKIRNVAGDERIKQGEACRTGRIIHVRESVAPHIITNLKPGTPIVFIGTAGFEKLLKIYENITPAEAAPEKPEETT